MIEVQEKYRGEWLNFKNRIWETPDGRRHTWESVGRESQPDIVIIIPRLKQSGKYLIVYQYRPPIESYCYEFPAGLVEKGETNEAGAIRELKEETGYTGEVHSIYPFRAVGPGITEEKIHVVEMTVDESAEMNQNVEQKLDPSEDLKVCLMDFEELKDLALSPLTDSFSVDVKITFFVLGKLFG